MTLRTPIIWEPESAGRWVHRPTGVVVERYREQWIQKTFALDRVVGRTYWRVVLPSGEAKGRYRSKGDAIPFGETCVNRLDDRYAKTARAAAADGFTETWLTLSQLLRTTDKDQHEAILSALDNPTVIGLHRRSRTDIRLIMNGDTELYARKRSEVHLKEGLTRAPARRHRERDRAGTALAGRSPDRGRVLGRPALSDQPLDHHPRDRRAPAAPGLREVRPGRAQGVLCRLSVLILWTMGVLTLPTPR